MHTNQMSISTQKQQQIDRKAGRGAGLLHAPYAGSYLPLLKPSSLLAGSYITLEKKQMATLFPGNDAKMLSSKKCIFHLYLPYINLWI